MDPRTLRRHSPRYPHGTPSCILSRPVVVVASAVLANVTQNMAAERREGWLFRCTKNVRVLHYNLCGSLEGTLRRSPRQASVPRGKPGDIEQSLYLKMRPSLFGDPSMAYVAPVVALRPGGGCQTPCGGTGERGDHVSPAVDNRHAHSVARIPHKDLAI